MTRGRPGTSTSPTAPSTIDDAERIYYGAISTALCKRAFCAEAAHLEAHSLEAGEYLRWLLQRGQAWPKVS